MRIDTLNYRKKIPTQAAHFYQVLLEEQLSYFQSKDPSITELTEGAAVTTALQTKLGQATVESTMTIQRLVKDELLEMTTDYSGGKIIQTYHLNRQDEQQFTLLYSERNELVDAKTQLSLLFVLPFYKFFYNRQLAKRVNYLIQKL
ncbi:DUF3284 domain-containing protein [Enterococcus mundtii]|uniref:DUF3284 domain-containing protein n=1 Tax=Enterococcus mundtii TaxID=53346 RepID=A0A2S7RSF8_ENTMU|nr:DUF3284 domain-containing protein [Enterococcus mundtii]PQF22528.1 hypothetical protein CUS89_10360 [Enterococcus mundtii]PTO39425.1 DUF3284 domain-containing protein [Enterococcus mundtii]PTO44375.1 DUF3284 domain-containing protein [Enterococcus mundtii]